MPDVVQSSARRETREIGTGSTFVAHIGNVASKAWALPWIKRPKMSSSATVWTPRRQFASLPSSAAAQVPCRGGMRCPSECEVQGCLLRRQSGDHSYHPDWKFRANDAHRYNSKNFSAKKEQTSKGFFSLMQCYQVDRALHEQNEMGACAQSYWSSTGAVGLENKNTTCSQKQSASCCRFCERNVQPAPT